MAKIESPEKLIEAGKDVMMTFMSATTATS